MLEIIISIKEFLFNSIVQLFLLFFFLPFCINFHGCIKNKRNLFYSLLLSSLYPGLIIAAIFLATAIWFGTSMWVDQNFDISTWIGLPLLMIGALICFWPVGPIWQSVYNFFDNYKYEGIFSFDVEVARKRLNK